MNDSVKTLFEQAMNLWFLPEIERRRIAGKIAEPFDLRSAQVIFYLDGRPPEIRLNEEVQIVANVKLRETVSKEKSEPVYNDEVENYESFKLLETDDPNCGHFTVIRIDNYWYLAFDFRYNKGRSKELLQTAKEFLETAEYALTKNNLRAFIDNLFSAAELTATVFLIISPRPNQGLDIGHGQVHSQFNWLAKLGNVDASHRETFNNLASIRSRARYVRGDFTLPLPEATSHLLKIKGLLERAERFIKSE